MNEKKNNFFRHKCKKLLLTVAIDKYGVGVDGGQAQLREQQPKGLLFERFLMFCSDVSLCVLLLCFVVVFCCFDFLFVDRVLSEVSCTISRLNKVKAWGYIAETRAWALTRGTTERWGESWAGWCVGYTSVSRVAWGDSRSRTVYPSGSESATVLV